MPKLFRSVAGIGYCFGYLFSDILTLNNYKNAWRCDEINDFGFINTEIVDEISNNVKENSEMGWISP